MIFDIYISGNSLGHSVSSIFSGDQYLTGLISGYPLGISGWLDTPYVILHSNIKQMYDYTDTKLIHTPPARNSHISTIFCNLIKPPHNGSPETTLLLTLNFFLSILKNKKIHHFNVLLMHFDITIPRMIHIFPATIFCSLKHPFSVSPEVAHHLR